MVTVLGEAEQALQHATPAHRSRIATQLAERVREDALVSKGLFSVVVDENNGLEQREVERLRSGLLLNERTAELMRQNLRRKHPTATEAEIDDHLQRWLMDRPGAELGDGHGTPRPWP